jgi:predicted RNase H-like HicB family nuclease
MIREYIDAAMHKARYEIIEEDKTFYGEIPECKGVWANNKTLEACRTELESVLEDWLLVGISEHHTLPIIDDIDLNKIYSQPIAA